MRMTLASRALALSVLVIFAAGALAPDLNAQYWGRNKVQYQTFNFKVMKTRHFDIYFYLEDEQTVKIAAQMAERWYARYARLFNYELKSRQPLILYGSGSQFQETTVIPGLMGEGTGGVTESFKRRIVLPYGPSLAETDHVIGHELVHAFQYDIMAQGHSDAARINDETLRLPLWFIEGMAEYFSIGSVDANTAMWMRDAVRRKDLPTINKLEDIYKYFPYRWGQALWAYISGRWGDEVIGKIMKSIGRTGDYEIILQGLLGIRNKQLAADWHKSLQQAYTPLIDRTLTPDKYGRVLLKGTEDSIYNVSPSISPDGKEVVFFSSRDLFSMDMFLADAETGKVQRKLISTALDPHFESIQFIRSAGSWNLKGDKFVFGVIVKGRPELTIIDMKRDRVVKEIPFGELGEILSPCWSPDDRYIAFSALVGGVTDLFIYDLEHNVLKQMTRDAYGDLQPVWSPDGKKIAFVTERFSANLDWADPGHYELALLDVESGQIQKVLAFPNGKNIDPQWTADSQGLYFLSDQSGKTDLYRIDLGTGKIFEVTNLYAGISGITDLSPAISLASQTGRIVYSAYEGGYYSIYSISDKTVLEGQSFLAKFERDPAILPPRNEPEGALLALQRNPLFGLPRETNYAVTDYKPRLSLDYLQPPTLAVAVDRYGTYGAGGISAFWSDMLGYRTIITTAITGPEIIDTSGAVAYLNTRTRLNWGLAVQRIVYPFPYYSVAEDDTTFSVPALVEQELIQRIINNDVSVFASYPFNSVLRVELTAGFRNIGFSNTLYTWAYSMETGTEIFYSEEHPAAPPSLNYGYVTGGLYYDTGIFGATSPILGQSFGLEISPAIGNISFESVYADLRKYIIPIKPFTLAFRAMHIGRYGPDAEDERFYPLYIGYWDLVRGYDEYTSTSTFDYGRLFGSKMLVGNVELRFPLLRVLHLGKGYFGAWPLEFYAFYDWGIAWANEPGYWWGGYDANGNPDPKLVRPWFLGGDRKPLTSTGIGIRTNLFGMLVMGLNYVYPFADPATGWHFQFYISPGF